jgi:hypothetical protein
MRLQALLSLVLVATLPGGEGAERTRCLPLGPAIELRIERFVLERRSTDENGRTRTDVAGFVEWRRRDDAAGPQLELDARFLRGPVGVADLQRVLQVECLTERGPRCVWREVGPGSGRSVQAEWSEDGGALDIVEWSAAGKKRGTLVASGGVSMPLYLAELVRAGRITAGPVTQFDPLARTLEPLMVRTVWLEDVDDADVDSHVDPAAPHVDRAAPHEDPAAPQNESAASARAGSGPSPAAEAIPTPDAHGQHGSNAGDAAPAPVRQQRTVELLRADGTLAARYRFAGLDLVSFQWQEGRMSARAIDAEQFDRLLAQHTPAAQGAPGRRSR